MTKLRCCFRSRSALLHYQSVVAKPHHKALPHFLEVIDWLLSTPHRPGRMVVLAAKLPDSMDPALKSRICVEVAFEIALGYLAPTKASKSKHGPPRHFDTNSGGFYLVAQVYSRIPFGQEVR